MHPNTGEFNYNESAYYNFFDRGQRLGGFVRLGNRPNEGAAEMTVCLYQPDATVGFMLQRPQIKNNDAHDAGGLQFRVIKPLEHHRVTYAGKVCVLKDPLEMAEPALAFKSNPFVQVCTWNLTTGPAPPPGEGAARAAGGSVGLAAERWRSGGPVRQRSLRTAWPRDRLDQNDDREYRFDAPGLRDHSWGPRYLQAPKYYRWLTMNFDEGLGGMASVTVNRDGSEHAGGFIARKGQDTLTVRKVEIVTEFTSEQKLHDKIKAIVWAAGRDEPLIITGKVISMIPLRNRRAGM